MLGFILGCSLFVLQAAFLDRQFIDLLPVTEDIFSPAEVEIGRCDVVQAFVVTAVVRRSSVS